MDLLAACSASTQDSDPMMIILPDLKTKIVLLGLVLRIMTAGKRFLLQRQPSTFSAIVLRSRSFSILILANDTTFWTSGRWECPLVFSIPPKTKINQSLILNLIYSCSQLHIYGLFLHICLIAALLLTRFPMVAASAIISLIAILWGPLSDRTVLILRNQCWQSDLNRKGCELWRA